MDTYFLLMRQSEKLVKAIQVPEITYFTKDDIEESVIIECGKQLGVFLYKEASVAFLQGLQVGLRIVSE